MSAITVTDLFCGAGGSSSGAIEVPGVTVRMAANHWDLAIETHNTNHPDTDHDSADISQVDPRRYPRTDILWASPECTNHSQAKGKKRATPQAELDLWEAPPLPNAAAERSRATMWDVPRFAEHHRYQAIVVENVVDAYRWVPFPAWLQTMELLGYAHEIVWLNSMHAQALGLPAPQSRDRMYVVFWRKGNRRPDLQKWTRPRAFCLEHGEVRAVQAFKRPESWGRYRAQYVYRCPQCAAVVEPGWLPAYTAINVHHRQRRREGGHALENLIALCGSGTSGCHGWAHAHPEAARSLGYIVPTWVNPAKIPVRATTVRHQAGQPISAAPSHWYLLGLDGTREQIIPALAAELLAAFGLIGRSVS